MNDGQGRNVATYSHDAVGNLLSTARITCGVGASTITTFATNSRNRGATVTVSLTGTNLTGAALATDNPGILVRNVLTSPTTLTATFQTSCTAALARQRNTRHIFDTPKLPMLKSAELLRFSSPFCPLYLAEG